MFFNSAVLFFGITLFCLSASASDESVDLEFTQTKWPMTLTAQILVPAPPEKVWNTLTNYDHLADFLPGMESSRIVRRTEDQIILEQISRNRFLFFRKKIKIILNISEKKDREISFYKIGGDMELFSGKWILKQVEEGKGTLLIYMLKFKPAFYVPRWVIRYTLEHDIPDQLRIISRQSESSG
ncbi:MAG: SRPBCC family protein [Nitrospirae bacterium]|nr:SRPBCC family protein [Nitrospirota bacterium]